MKEVGDMEIEKEEEEERVLAASSASSTSRYENYEDEISGDLNLASMIDKVFSFTEQK